MRAVRIAPPCPALSVLPAVQVDEDGVYARGLLTCACPSTAAAGRWGIAVASWACWLAVIDRYVGELVGVAWANWLDGDSLYARLSPRR
jgi:hypothetical protein